MKARLHAWVGFCLVLLLTTPAWGQEMGPTRRAYREGLMQIKGQERIKELTAKIESGGLSPQALAEAYYQRGQVWCNLGQGERGVADLNKAIAARPDFGQAYFARGELYMKSGRLPQAVADYDKAIQMAPDFAGAYNDRGRALHKMGKLQPAKADFDQAIALNNDRRAVAFALHNRGNLLSDTGHFKEALADYDRSHALGNQGPGLLFKRGLARLANGQADQAEADLAQVVQKAPREANAFLVLGHALLAQGNYDKSLAAYDRAVTLGQQADVYLLGRGACQFAQGQFAPAAKDFEEAFHRAGKKMRPVILVWWYLALERQGQSGKTLLERHAKIEVSDPAVADVLAYYRGQTDFHRVVRGQDGDAGMPAQEMGQRFFYLGQKELLNKWVSQAKTWFQECMKYESPVSYEYLVAQAELRRLKTSPAKVAANAGGDEPAPKRKRARSKKKPAEE